MHLKLDKTFENVERMERLRREGKCKMRIRVVMLDTTEIHGQLPAIVQFWAERGVKVHILWDGRLVQCCADWEQSGVMGDASMDAIRTIWMNTKCREYRARFLAGQVKGMLCDGWTEDGEDEED